MSDEADYFNDRSFFERLLFRSSGRPIRPLMRLAFHANGRPRGGLLGRIARNNNGKTRGPFVRWLCSAEYAAMPWPKAHAGQTAEIPLNRAESLSNSDGLIGPDPKVHPRRHAILARLAEAQQARRNDE